MLITASELGHTFGNYPLFKKLSFVMRAGEVVSIMGPSGSGKTTLLGIIAGWTIPTTGSVTHENVTTIRWVFQNPHGVSRRTALDHVVLPLLAGGRGRRDAEIRAGDLMADVGLNNVKGKQFRSLSGGEAQRLMFARALAGAPDLILVDEPTAQLDPANSAAVISAMKALAGRGSIVVVATHDPNVAQACTRQIGLSAQ